MIATVQHCYIPVTFAMLLLTGLPCVARAVFVNELAAVVVCCAYFCLFLVSLIVRTSLSNYCERLLTCDVSSRMLRTPSLTVVVRCCGDRV